MKFQNLCCIFDSRTSGSLWFDTIDHDKLEFIFSMCKGYLDRHNQFDDYIDVKLTTLHTSGHAYIENLQKLVEKMQPKHLIPIHTDCKDKYQELFEAIL